MKPAPEPDLQKTNSTEFVEEVLKLNLRTVAFDCDGTLWAGDAGEGFFSWELDRGIIADDLARWVRDRYAAYRAGKVSEDDMCGEMVTIHRGLTEALVQRAADEYFDQYFVPQIFPEMKSLVEKLLARGCEVWAVSSTNEWVIRSGMRHFGIPEKRILAAAVEVKDGIVTDRLVRVPSGDGKPQALRRVLKSRLDAAFGNSKWDIAMLQMADRGFAVNPNPDLENIAQTKGWRIHFPKLG